MIEEHDEGIEGFDDQDMLEEQLKLEAEMNAIPDSPLPPDEPIEIKEAAETLPKASVQLPELMETNKSLKSKFAGISELNLGSL